MIHLVRNSLLWIMAMLPFCLYAQSFKNRADIDRVPVAGFYAIRIRPALSSFIKTDFSDLRIMDEKEKPVPYLLESDLPLLKSSYYKPLKIVKNLVADSGRNIIIIENNLRGSIAGFAIHIKNAAVNRTVDISGGDDAKHWYSITENIELFERNLTDSDSYTENVKFPLSSYRYFKMVIYNGKNDPLNIVSVQSETSGSRNVVPCMDNPPCRFIQKDSSDHVSYITVYNPDSFHIGTVSLQVKGEKFFKREATIVLSRQTLSGFTISSDAALQFYVPVFKDSCWLIKIYNGDNPPLVVTGIMTGQRAEKIITYLEADKQYHLEMNNDQVAIPAYDLADFKDSVPRDAAEVKVGDSKPVVTPAIAAKNGHPGNLLWPVLIAVLALLLFFTRRLITEVKKNDRA